MDASEALKLFKEGKSLAGADLCGADLRGANLRGADLCGADLYGANLRGADLYGANLCGANLRGANLRGAYLRGANLRWAYLCGADLCGADLCGANLDQADLGEQWIVPGMMRSDGYYFYLQKLTGDVEPMVRAGCRLFTLAQAQAHWEATRRGTKLFDETRIIVRAMVDIAHSRGLM